MSEIRARLSGFAQSGKTAHILLTKSARISDIRRIPPRKTATPLRFREIDTTLG
ncbi:hypothetical protein [Paracoccus alkanivorans]|uniref:hypothetical protein n=1 Tax=Paracoccus alkanivorans TaxID=2116655 RepID=UPI00140D95D1|nr:hypothetical protein [Paracoccus alkanivorans]